MKRAGILGVAIVLTIGLIGGTADAKKKRVKVNTEVTIEGFDDSNYPPDVTFFGEIDAKKAKCLRNRRVDLEQTTDSLDAGSDKTAQSGDWEITFDGLEVPAGDFQATVAKRKIKKKKDGEVKKVFVCKEAVSPVFEGPPDM